MNWSYFEDLPAITRFFIYVLAGIVGTALVKVAVSLICRALEASTAKLNFIRSARQESRRLQIQVRFAGSVAHLVIWIVVLAATLRLLGVQPGYTAGAVGLIGLVLTGLFRDLVVDVAKGFEILSGGHYLVGDFIEVNGVKGHVMAFNIKATKLRTASGEEVVLPNSVCVPSRRFPSGYVNYYVDMVLAEPMQFELLQKLLNRLARDLNDANEMIRQAPDIVVVLTRHEDRRPLVRWRVQVLPGAEEVMKERVLPALNKTLEEGGIKLIGEPTMFCLNGLRTFRQLFNRTLHEREIKEILSKEETVQANEWQS